MSAAPAASIAMHAVMFPALTELESQDETAAAALHAIRSALEKAEANNPGLAHEFVDHVLDAAQSKGGINITEKLLRAANTDIDDYKFEAKTAELGTLAEKGQALKHILSTIPDEVQNRTSFLGIIRKIAESIKEVLDAANGVANNNGDLLGSHLSALQNRRKAFVRCSKMFSDTLKRYFKEGRADELFRAAHRLIDQTNSLLRTVKAALE
jgi:programmed cell death protein 10